MFQYSKTHINQLTALRGFAAIFVAVFHGQFDIAGFDLKPWTHFFDKGYLGVDFFFLLSGFILSYTYIEKWESGNFSYKKFIRNRFARIYPVHLVTLLLAVVLLFFSQELGEQKYYSNTMVSFLGNLTMTHSWGFVTKYSWNFASWSVSAEWLAYLTFPIWISLSYLVGKTIYRNIVLTFLCLASVFAYSRAVDVNSFDLIYINSIARVSLQFLAGCFLHNIFITLKSKKIKLFKPINTILIIFLLLTMHLQFHDKLLQDFLAVSLIAALIVSLSLSKSTVSRLLQKRPLVYMGEISYSFYLLHSLILMTINRTGIKPETTTLLGGSLVLLAYLVSVGILAHVFYRYIEIPARNKIRTVATK